MTDEDPTRSEIAVIEAGQRLPQPIIEAYWSWTARTLVHVFDKAEAEAGQLVRSLKEKIESRVTPDFQSAPYHFDPFQVAADLACIAEVSPEQKLRYSQMSWRDDQQPGPGIAAFARDIPDDIPSTFHP